MSEWIGLDCWSDWCRRCGLIWRGATSSRRVAPMEERVEVVGAGPDRKGLDRNGTERRLGACGHGFPQQRTQRRREALASRPAQSPQRRSLWLLASHWLTGRALSVGLHVVRELRKPYSQAAPHPNAPYRTGRSAADLQRSQVHYMHSAWFSNVSVAELRGFGFVRFENVTVKHLIAHHVSSQRSEGVFSLIMRQLWNDAHISHEPNALHTNQAMGERGTSVRSRIKYSTSVLRTSYMTAVPVHDSRVLNMQCEYQ